MARFDMTRKQFVRLGIGLGGVQILGCGTSPTSGGGGGAGPDAQLGTGAGAGGPDAVLANGGAGQKDGGAGGTPGGGGSSVPDGPVGPDVPDAGAGGKDLVIDSHVHVWTGDPVAFPYAHPYEKAAYKPGAAPGTVEVLIAEMDELGIDNCVLVQGIQHGWDNSYVASCLKAHPKRFRAHGLIDPTDPLVADKLDFWVKQHAFSGMRISPVYYPGRDAWMNGDAHKLLWKKAEDLGAILNYFLTTTQLARLEDMIKQFPKVRIVVDHLARVDLTAPDPLPEFKKLLALAAYPNVWVKVSELVRLSPSHQYPFTDTYPWVKRMYDAFGPDRLMWGTGFPGAAAKIEVGWPTGPQELDLIRTKIGFPPGDVAKILGRNAARLWGFPIR